MINRTNESGLLTCQGGGLRSTCNGFLNRCGTWCLLSSARARTIDQASLSVWRRKAKDSIVAVGTTIADRPPHRSVQARLRIRLLSWMCGGKAGIRVRMQNTGLRNPPVQERDETIPSHLGALTATD